MKNIISFEASKLIQSGEKFNGREFVAIPDFPGYFISRDGTVVSVRQKPVILIPDEIRGYLRVTIYQDKKKVRFFVHHLVLRVFSKTDRPVGWQTRHLNGMKNDNHIDNLVWGTGLENCKDRSVHGKTARGERIGNSKLTEIVVERVRKRPESHTELAKEMGVSRTLIRKIRNRELWKHVA